MNDYFEEKAHQVSYDGNLEAFGITLESRYSKAGEIAEMLVFANLVALENLNHLVSEVFYDSKSDLCTFKLSNELERYSDESDKIKRCALKAISQFDFQGIIYHGEPLEEVFSKDT